MLHLKKPLVFFDLETTGISVVNDRIVEYSFIKIMPNGEKIIQTKKINPERAIPLETSMIHGIYDEHVKDAPTFKLIAKDLSKFLEGCDLAGFNMLRFYLPMLVEEFLRIGLDFSTTGRNLIDAQKIYHLMEPRTLSAAYKFYCQKDLEGAHTAEADTLATFEVLEAQVLKYENMMITDRNKVEFVPVKNDMQHLHNLTAENLVDFANSMVFKNGVEVFNIGKHKGRPVEDVLKAEPSYYDWYQKADFSLNSKRKLTEIKLRMAFPKK